MISIPESSQDAKDPVRYDVSVIVLTHNSRNSIDCCLESVFKQHVSAEVILIDSGSEDDTVSHVKSTHPSVKVKSLRDNVGYSKGNNIGILEASSEILAILNPDAILLDDALMRLVRLVKRRERAIVSPVILLPGSEKVNASGLACNPLGFGFPRGLGVSKEDARQNESVSGVSGCCIVARKDTLLGIGAFDDDFFMYNEDVDLSWRAHLLNYETVIETSCYVQHEYKPEITLFKLMQIERNRRIVLKKYLPFRWAAILLPSLMIAEAISTAAFMRFGLKGVSARLSVWANSISLSPGKIRGNLANLQKHLDPVFPSEPTLTGSEVETAVRKATDVILKINWRLIR
ncbi:MAG: glycosyltransferase family 2 protein [Methanobacteriota archaeon]|nr:MAG: glycosyltransferase family 2 protein [Euryarchaeota archaeon]